MARKERIELHDTLMSAVIKLCGGNPGALRACCEMAKTSPTVDPDSFAGGLGPLLSLDTQGIYGPRIWMLFSDVCECDPIKALALLRAVQLGFLSESDLDHAIDNRGQGVDVDAMVAAVKGRLPRFRSEAVAA